MVLHLMLVEISGEMRQVTVMAMNVSTHMYRHEHTNRSVLCTGTSIHTG